MPLNAESLDKFLKQFGKHLPALAIAIVSVLDMFGAFDNVRWLQARLPAIILLVSATILEFALWNQDRLEKLAASFREMSAEASGKVDSAFRDLKAEISKDPLQKLDDMKARLDPRITRVIGPYMEEQIAYLAGIFNDGSFELESDEKFATFYQDTLNAYNPAHFDSTSIPTKNFFWRRRKIVAAIYGFLRNKNSSMRRVFLLENVQQLDDPEVNLILRCQKEIGVDVYTVLKKDVAQEWPNCFMVDSLGRIGWELEVDADARTIKRARLRWRTSDTDDLIKRFRRIEGAESLRQFTSGHHPDPNTSGSTQYDEKEFRSYEWRQWQDISMIAGYEKYFGPLMKQTAQVLVGVLVKGSRASGVQFLDVASGLGYLAASARELGAEVTAVDFSDPAVNQARDLYPDINFQVGDAENLREFPDGSFDIVGINFGIMHFWCPDAAIKEVHRVLRSGGRFGFTVWNRDETGGLGLVMRALEALEDPTLSPPSGPPFFRFSDVWECRKTLEEAGFNGAKIKVIEKHELVWNLTSGEEVFNAFLTGTARMGGRLRAQEPWALDLIRELVKLRSAECKHQEYLRVPYSIVYAEKD